MPPDHRLYLTLKSDVVPESSCRYCRHSVGDAHRLAITELMYYSNPSFSEVFLVPIGGRFVCTATDPFGRPCHCQRPFSLSPSIEVDPHTRRLPRYKIFRRRFTIPSEVETVETVKAPHEIILRLFTDDGSLDEKVSVMISPQDIVGFAVIELVDGREIVVGEHGTTDGT